MTHVISLGAGVQSSTMALMAACGEIDPMPVAAVFADTGDEPKSVYMWLDWLEKELPFPVERVCNTRGPSLAESALTVQTSKEGGLYTKTSIPVFVRNPDGSLGKVGFRNCTEDFKIIPVRQALRRWGKITRGQKSIGIVQWIGISLDEATRMKDARDKWCENRWPLIEARMTRQDCLRWMESHGYPAPPRSACVYCPFHNDAEWRRLKTDEPAEFERAIEFERQLQSATARIGKTRPRSIPFLHRSLVTLDQVDFRNATDRGQRNFFENECAGMCGV